MLGYSVLIRWGHENYWKQNKSGGDVSDVLISIEIPVVSDFDCNSAYAGDYNKDPVKASMMCAGGAPGQ